MRTFLRSKIRLLFVAFAMVLAIPAIALADNAVSDGDGVTPLANQDMAFSDVGCNVASTKTALIAISRQGSGQVFKNGSTVTVTASATGSGLSAAMDSPNTITLPTDWVSKSNGTLSNNVSSTVTVNSSTPGQGSGTVTYTASGTGTDNNPLTRTDTMNVTWNTGSCDTTAPSVSSIAVADANPTNTTGNVSWDVTFSESVTGVDASDFNLVNTGLGGSPAITNVSGSGASYTVTASSGSGSGTLGLNLTDNDSIADAAGNKLGGTNAGNGDFTGDVYVIDRAAPTMTGSATLGPGFTDPYSANSWTNQSVRVTFTCADTGGSGLTGTSANNVQNFSTETSASGAAATSGGTCVDNAGNTAAAANFGPIKIDKTLPSVGTNGTATGTLGDNGWYTSAVSQPFRASDALSGLVGLTSPHDYSIGSGLAEGNNVSIASGGFSDNAGNSNSGTSVGPFKIDLTNPTTNVAVTPAIPAGTGWYNLTTGAPTADFSCADADGDNDATNGGASGVATCPDDVTFSSNASAQSAQGSATDNAGRSDQTPASVSGIKVDLSKPTNVAFQGGPAAGSSYDFGSVPAAPTGCTADDTFSGMPANGCVVTGYSTAVGNHTLTATATDTAGNKETATRSYSVKAANASGFYSPVDMGGILNTGVKAGSTIPVKFELFGGATNTEQKTTSAVGSMTARQVSCGAFTGAPTDNIEYLAPTSENTGLRFDLTGDQFIYNWKTPKQVGCYSLTMTAADNTTTLVAYFQLK